MTTVIIGAGVGGLSAAIALAAAGEPVLVIEKQAGPGGKLLPVEVAGTAADSGPTVLTMMWVFEDLFSRAGQDAWQILRPTQLDVLARHYWSGGTSLDLFADREQSADAIGRLAGRQEARGYLAFAAAAQRMHDALREPFLKAQRPTPWGLSSTMSFTDLMRINPFESLWHALGHYFRDPRLRQLFGRYATYCGSSPFKAPATLMLVADVEARGVWRLPSGMAGLAHSLHKVASDLGVRFAFNASATRIECTGSIATAVIDDLEQRHACSAVVVNADSGALSAGLFGKAATSAARAPQQRDLSLSAVTWCGHVSHEGPALDHHNVFFSDDYKREFEQLAHGPAEDPTTYLCAQGNDLKLVLVNAPANAKDASPSIEKNMLRRLEKCGVKLRMTPATVLRRSPKEFAALYPATQGALYGRASHGWMSTFLRPQARTQIPNLYLAGGSAHPGPGVPMATLSGMRAAEALLQDQALTRPSKMTAIAGGTSTH